MNNDIDSKILSGKTIKNIWRWPWQGNGQAEVWSRACICWYAPHSITHQLPSTALVDASVDDFDHSGDDFDDGNYDNDNIQGVTKKLLKEC